jgi:hypothetical protein
MPQAPSVRFAHDEPLRCWLTFHDWRLVVNDEGQRYKPAHDVAPTVTSIHAQACETGFIDEGFGAAPD